MPPHLKSLARLYHRGRWTPEKAFRGLLQEPKAPKEMEFLPFSSPSKFCYSTSPIHLCSVPWAPSICCDHTSRPGPLSLACLLSVLSTWKIAQHLESPPSGHSPSVDPRCQLSEIPSPPWSGLLAFPESSIRLRWPTSFPFLAPVQLFRGPGTPSHCPDPTTFFSLRTPHFSGLDLNDHFSDRLSCQPRFGGLPRPISSSWPPGILLLHYLFLLWLSSSWEIAVSCW